MCIVCTLGYVPRYTMADGWARNKAEPSRLGEMASSPDVGPQGII